MEFRIPTLGWHRVDVDGPDARNAKRAKDDADRGLRERASDLASAASDRASGIAGAAASVASDLPKVELPDLGKAVAPAAKAVGDGVSAVADSFRGIGKGIEQWRKPKKQEPPVAEAGIALLAGMGGGMALMYFLDPEQGRRRRSMLVARLGRWSRTASGALGSGGRGLADRSQGVKASVSSMVRRSASADDTAAADVSSGPDASRDLEATDAAASTGSSASWGGGATPEPSLAAASADVYGSTWPDTTGSSAAGSSAAGSVTGSVGQTTDLTEPRTDLYGQAAGDTGPDELPDRNRMGSEG